MTLYKAFLCAVLLCTTGSSPWRINVLKTHGPSSFYISDGKLTFIVNAPNVWCHCRGAMFWLFFHNSAEFLALRCFFVIDSLDNMPGPSDLYFCVASTGLGCVPICEYQKLRFVRLFIFGHSKHIRNIYRGMPWRVTHEVLLCMICGEERKPNRTLLGANSRL